MRAGAGDGATVGTLVTWLVRAEGGNGGGGEGDPGGHGDGEGGGKTVRARGSDAVEGATVDELACCCCRGGGKAVRASGSDAVVGAAVGALN
eukprot:4390348-Prymnesium_polylepis.1